MHKCELLVNYLLYKKKKEKKMFREESYSFLYSNRFVITFSVKDCQPVRVESLVRISSADIFTLIL